MGASHKNMRRASSMGHRSRPASGSKWTAKMSVLAFAQKDPRNSGLLHVFTRGSQRKAQKENGSSVAYKIRRTFLSQRMGHEDASGQAADK